MRDEQNGGFEHFVYHYSSLILSLQALHGLGFYWSSISRSILTSSSATSNRYVFKLLLVVRSNQSVLSFLICFFYFHWICFNIWASDSPCWISLFDINLITWLIVLESMTQNKVLWPVASKLCVALLVCCTLVRLLDHRKRCLLNRSRNPKTYILFCNFCLSGCSLSCPPYVVMEIPKRLRV